MVLNAKLVIVAMETPFDRVLVSKTCVLLDGVLL